VHNRIEGRRIESRRGRGGEATQLWLLCSFVAGEASKLEFASEAEEHAEDESVCSSSSLWHRARRRRDLAKACHSERDVSTAAIERDTSFKKEERTEEVW
jgi:hypothetical protein